MKNPKSVDGGGAEAHFKPFINPPFHDSTKNNTHMEGSKTEKAGKAHFIHLHNGMPRSSTINIISRLDEDGKHGIPLEREYTFDLESGDTITIRISESVHSAMREAAAVQRGAERGRSLIRRHHNKPKRKRATPRRGGRRARAPRQPQVSEAELLAHLKGLNIIKPDEEEEEEQET